MTSQETIPVNVGDLVVYSEHPDANVAVVTEVRPRLHVADIMENSSGDTGLLLSTPGTVESPVEVIGSIPLPDILEGFTRQLKDPSKVDFEAELQELKDAEAEGPVEFPRLKLGTAQITPPGKPEVSDLSIDLAPTPKENPQLAQDIARFILREVWGKSIPDQFELDGLLDNLKRRTTVIAFTGDGEILATGCIQKTPDKNQMMIVDVAVRSGSREVGIGTQIIQSLEEIARLKGAKRTCLIAINDTDEFYEHENLGYRLEGNTHIKDL